MGGHRVHPTHSQGVSEGFLDDWRVWQAGVRSQIGSEEWEVMVLTHQKSQSSVKAQGSLVPRDSPASELLSTLSEGTSPCSLSGTCVHAGLVELEGFLLPRAQVPGTGGFQDSPEPFLALLCKGLEGSTGS